MNLEPHNKQQDNSIRIEQQQKKQKEYHLIGQIRRIPGLTLFEFNKRTKEIRPASVSRTIGVKYDGTTYFRTRTDVRQDCFYLQALNIKNAEKKLRKLGLL